MKRRTVWLNIISSGFMLLTQNWCISLESWCPHSLGNVLSTLLAVSPVSSLFFLMHISPSFFLNDFFLLLPSLPHYIVRLLRPLSNSTFSFSELDSACLRLECPTLISFPLPLLSSLVFDFFYFSIYLHWRNGSRAVRIDRWMTRG